MNHIPNVSPSKQLILSFWCLRVIKHLRQIYIYPQIHLTNKRLSCLFYDLIYFLRKRWKLFILFWNLPFETLWQRILCWHEFISSPWKTMFKQWTFAISEALVLLLWASRKNSRHLWTLMEEKHMEIKSRERSALTRISLRSTEESELIWWKLRGPQGHKQVLKPWVTLIFFIK